MVFRMRYAFLLFLLLFSSASALYNGNPALPAIPEEGFYIAKEAWMAARVGYEGDFVFDHRMNRRVHEFQTLENFGTLTLTFIERFEIYGSGGSFWAKMRRQNQLGLLEARTHSDGVWKVGGRAILWKYGDTFLTLHVGYESASAKLREVTLNGAPLARKGSKLFYHEVEAGLGVAHRIDVFIPYVGVDSSYAKVKLRHLAVEGEKRILCHNRQPVGFFLGCGLSPGTKFVLNVEVRLVDEQALTLSGDIRF